MDRIKAFFSRLLRREQASLPEDPFGEPGGPIENEQTVDSVALSQLPVNKMWVG
jgi:hypothetical protein